MNRYSSPVDEEEEYYLEVVKTVKHISFLIIAILLLGDILLSSILTIFLLVFIRTGLL